MYWYKLKTHKETKFLTDKAVDNPYLYFGGTQVEYWGHKNDETGVIDMNWPLHNHFNESENTSEES
jgi:hypothetical protein